jgi:protein SCO1/2
VVAVGAAMCLAFLAAGVAGAAGKEYQVHGMVLDVDRTKRQFVVSHEPIAGLMDSMVMPFEVQDARDLRGLVPGAIVEFSLVIGSTAGYATRIVVKRYESVEQDPLTARRLAVMRRMAGLAPTSLAVGARVPDFTLINQAKQRVSLDSLAGKVLALNFIYTRCALPQFCLRASNNFGVLQKRFAAELSRGELVLLTVSFDPERDTPEALATYAAQWNADPRRWHFLTGEVPTVRRVCALFGVDAFPDEGLMNHSLHTVVIDRQRTLVANIEGNRYDPRQLGDLVQQVLGD